MNEVKWRKPGEPPHMCACVRVPAHLAARHLSSAARICVLVNRDLGPLLSIPGRQRLSIITFNGLHMELASAGYINIPAYSNMRADGFPEIFLLAKILAHLGHGSYGVRKFQLNLFCVCVCCNGNCTAHRSPGELINLRLSKLGNCGFELPCVI